MTTPGLWRKKWRQAFFLLQKFFCNGPDLHDHDLLTTFSNHEDRKTNLFAQFGKSCASKKASTIAQAALLSDTLTDEDKECIRDSLRQREPAKEKDMASR